MADFIFNIAKGRIVELANRVNDNDPTNSAFILVVINAGAASDATLKDCDTLTAVLATAADEVTNTNYARKTITSLTVTTDDSGDLQSVDMADQTFSSISAGDGWTDLLVCYDADTTSGTNDNIIPLMQFDAPVTPDGTDIIITVNASGLMSAS